MISPCNSKPAFLKTDQGNDSKNAVFVFVKKIDSYLIPCKLRFLECKNFSNYCILAGVRVGQASRLPSKYLPLRERRLHHNSKVQSGRVSGISALNTNVCEAFDFKPTRLRIVLPILQNLGAVADAAQPTNSFKFHIKTLKRRTFRRYL
jgi:hypothetical protein